MGVEFKNFSATHSITHTISSLYYPQNQGALEATLTKLWESNTSEWDIDLPFALFCMQGMSHSSTRFNPFELVFGHRIRGPLRFVQDCLLDNEQVDVSVLDIVEDMRQRLLDFWLLVLENMEFSQNKSKAKKDLQAKARDFAPEQQVLVLIPQQGNCLAAKFSGPYTVIKKISGVACVLATPDRHRPQPVSPTQLHSARVSPTQLHPARVRPTLRLRTFPTPSVFFSDSPSVTDPTSRKDSLSHI